MRLIHGESLKEAIDELYAPPAADQKLRDQADRSLIFRRLLQRFITVCEAIQYAVTDRGVLHRDLKPSNIMLGKYGETLVVDWGYHKAVGKEEITTEDSRTSCQFDRQQLRDRPNPAQRLGRRHTSSPEQAETSRLEELGPATDIYGLGATLYHILTGQPPFRGSSQDVIQKVVRGDLPLPRSDNSRVPRGLEAICLKDHGTETGGSVSRRPEPSRRAGTLAG